MHYVCISLSTVSICVLGLGVLFTCWTPRTTQELVTRNPLTFFFFFSSFSHFQDSCYSLGEWVGYIGIAERERGRLVNWIWYYVIN